MIRFECPHCGKGLRTDPAMAGEAFTCPGCRGRVRVPKRSDESVARETGHPYGAANRFRVAPFEPPRFWTYRRVLRAGAAAVLAAIAAGLMVWPRSLIFAEWLAWTMAGLCALTACLLVFARWSGTSHAACRKCGGKKTLRELGVVERDSISAIEALEAGDLASLAAMSPEGQTISVVVAECPACGRAAPIDVRMTLRVSGSPDKEIAHVTYPGATLPIFERLCKMPTNS